ncbi:MAG: OmpH family outer membrane protein [bacterium]|nr:OmpH family outer membrane protein [bacterium]
MRFCVRFSLILVLVLFGTVTADANKIGFFEVERAVSSVEQGKVAVQQLDEWAQPRREYIAVLAIEATRFRTQLEQQSGVASPEAIEELQLKLRDKIRELEDEELNLTRAFEAKRKELLQEVAQRLDTVVREYSEQNGFDAVFLMKAVTLVYLADSANLTDPVVAIYNERFPVDSN